MTIQGLGIDLVEIARIERAMRKPRFLNRILTEAERSQNLTPAYVAGRWAAKEAVAKAVDIGLNWHDVVVVSTPTGAPVVHCRKLKPGQSLLVSISHERNHAVAVAILSGT
jgi:holo-[acyl-carrier protein] synthase